MKKSNKLIIILIIILIILILAVGGFAFVYFFTDIFKSNKDLFFKYVSQNSQIKEIFEQDEAIKLYNDKEKSVPYNVQGNLKISSSAENSMAASAIGKTSLSFSGISDNLNKYSYRNVKFNYSDTETFELEYINDKKNYGIKIPEIIKKYIAIDTNNLESLAKNLGIDTSIPVKIPKEIDLSRYDYTKIFTEEEWKTLKSNYQSIILNNLTDEMFSKNSSNENDVYTLKISNIQLKNILPQLLAKLKDDELILDKFKKIMINDLGMSDADATKYITQVKEYIQEIIDKLGQNSSDITTETKYLTINVYVSGKSLSKTEIVIEDVKISAINKGSSCTIELEKGNDINITFDIKKIVLPDSVQYSLAASQKNERLFALDITFSGLSTLETVQESFNFVIDFNNINVTYAYSGAKKFVDVAKNNVTSDEMVFLNTLSKTDIDNIFTQISERVVSLNNAKKTSAGFTSNAEEPIVLYAPAIIPYGTMLIIQNPEARKYTLPVAGFTAGLGMAIYSGARSTIDNSNLSNIEANIKDNTTDLNSENIVEQARKAKIESALTAFSEETKLAQFSIRAKISSGMISDSKYIATKQDIFSKLCDDIKTNLNKQEYNIYSFLDEGNENVKGTGYVLVTYTDNELRSALPANIGDEEKFKISSIEFTKASSQPVYSVNDAVIAYVIKVDNYNSSISNAILTDSETIQRDVLAGNNGENNKKATAFSNTTIGQKIKF